MRWYCVLSEGIDLSISIGTHWKIYTCLELKTGVDITSRHHSVAAKSLQPCKISGEMPHSIPALLAPYLQACLAPHTQTLVTSVLKTPSTWLSLRIVYAALYGVAEDGGPDHAETAATATDSRPLILVSLLSPLSLWVEMGKKVVCFNLSFSYASAKSACPQPIDLQNKMCRHFTS